MLSTATCRSSPWLASWMLDIWHDATAKIVGSPYASAVTPWFMNRRSGKGTIEHHGDGSTGGFVPRKTSRRDLSKAWAMRLASYSELRETQCAARSMGHMKAVHFDSPAGSAKASSGWCAARSAEESRLPGK